jgi:tetratricopeptide (TPR) repeat protein
MSKRRKKNRKRREQPPPLPKKEARPARSGKKWLLPLLGLGGVGVVAVLVANPFFRPDKPAPNPGEPAPVYPPGPLTGQSLEEETLDAARRLLTDFPDQPEPLGLMGTACSKLGRQAEAATWYRRSLDLNPNRAQAHYMMGEAAIERGEFELAEEWCRKALAIEPRLPGVNGRLGQVLMELGRPEEAVAALETEVRLSPHAVGEAFSLGQAYMELKQYEKAVAHLERAHRGMPRNPRPCYALATAYARLKQRDKAREYNEMFRERQAAKDRDKWERRKDDMDLISMSRVAADIHIGAGQVYAEKGRPEDAEEHWRRAAFLDKNNAQCRHLLSQMYSRRQQWPEALARCREIQRIAPENAVNHLNTGVALAYLSKLDESEQAVRHALRLNPRLVPAYHSLLQVLTHGGRKLPEAKAVAERLVGVEPKAENYVLLGNLCQQTGDRAGARAALEQAARLAPGNPEIKKAYRQLQSGR